MFHVWKRAAVAVGWQNVKVVVPSDDAGDFGAVLPANAVVRGSPFIDDSDVLGRLVTAVNETVRWDPPQFVVRLTGDCPFVPVDGIHAVVDAVRDGADYATLEPIPNGFDAEAFRGEMLVRANAEATDPYDREHVTSWIRRNAQNPVALPLYAHIPRYRWTLDTAEDLAWFQEVAKEIDCTPPHPTVEELLALLERRPDLVRMDE